MRIAMVSGDDVVDNDVNPLCSALAVRGEEVVAFVRRGAQSNKDQPDEREYSTIEAAAGPTAPVSPRDVLPFVGDWATELAQHWSSKPPDIVHAHGWLGGLAAQLAARSLSLPTVQTFQDPAATGSERPAGRAGAAQERGRIEPLLARSATWVTVGNSAEAHALARLRRGRAHVSLLAAGVDAAYYTPLGPVAPRNGRFRVACIERNSLPHNGFENAIRVLPKLANTELVLAETTSAARGAKAWAGLKRLAAELQVSDRVEWRGRVTDDEVPPLLRSADVAACTPSQAPRATTALQAMACELPVVAADIGALSDTVIHRVTGLVVAPNKPYELASALKTLQTETFQREGMGAAGRSRAISRFTWERIAVDAMSIYHRALTRHLNLQLLDCSQGDATGQRRSDAM